MSITTHTPEGALMTIPTPDGLEPGARHALVDSPVGPLTLVAAGEALTGVYFDGHSHPPEPGALGGRVDAADDIVLAAAAAQLREYFAGRRRTFELPLAPVGAEFRQRVWERLRAIEFGSTTTYGSIAAEFGDARLARAVGAAVGRNPLSIVVPCHRVVGSTGRLTGFAGGLDRKRLLLGLEGALPDGQAELF